MQKGLSILNFAFSVIGAMCFLEYRKSSEDTTVGTRYMDSVTEDKTVRRREKECTARGQR